MRFWLVGALALLAMGTAGAAPAYDPTSLSAADLLAKADKVAGTLNPGTYIRSYTSDSGGLHTEGVTKIAGADRETIEHTGPFTTAFGTVGGQRWRQNENGVVVLETGFHDSADPDANALRQTSATTMAVLGVTHDAPQEYALQVTPFRGQRELRFYDAQTYLLDRIEITGAGGRAHVWTFSSYHPIFGELIPYKVRYSDGRPANDAVIQITSFVQAPVQLTGIPSSRKLITSSNAAPIKIAATFDADGIVVPVKIGERSYNFLLDSGSDGLVLAPRIAAELGLPRYGLSKQYIGGEFDLSQTIVPDLSIGGVHLQNVAFNVAPVDRPDDADHLVGLLGLDFWDSAIVGIDFKNKTVTLYPPGASPPDPVGLSVLPIAIDDGVPRAHATVEGVAGNFLLDTGSGMTILYHAFFNQLRTKTPLNEELEVASIGGMEDMAGYTVGDFALGTTEFRFASIVVPPTIADEMPQYDGEIGRNVMEFYTLYFDYEGHAIYLKPNV